MLSEEQKKELDKDIQSLVDERVQKQVEERLSKEIIKRFSPGEETVKVVMSPEDKILADKFGGFKSAGHFYNDVIKAAKKGSGESDTLKAWDRAVTKTTGYMEEGDLAQGGYLVPTQVSANIIEKSLETAIVKPRAANQPMSSNRLEIPADVDENHATNYFGGVVIYRPGEAGSKTPTNPVFGKIALQLHKVTGLCYVSDELLEDSVVALEPYLTRKFGSAIAFVQDDDFLNGTGANMPIGAFNAANPSLITVTAVGGQGAATIVAENIIAMWARLYPAGQANAIWLANIETFPQLATMGIAVGAGGVPVWMPANNIAGQPFQSLMGRPIIYTEKMQALGTAGDIGLVDFSQYYVAEKGGLQVASSIHLLFNYDETAFRFVLRYDGQPSWLSTLTPRRGSATLSPFIVLASNRT